MRIEAYSQVQQLYNSSKVSREQNVQRKGQTDQVQISSKGLDLQTATAAVKGASDIRYDVVEPLKKAIANGTYNVSGESFAEKLMQKYAEL
ncbi:MAG: flagellar biosynthesis anti-sigma factor FlgM [Lachnospiraceae bacterium]|jgi:negative regulator of flagellin synthesis FlgM|nr:flagellar biosynthesis anti-sigma factor FlgM [Lachnospiraceae bacterium]